MLHGDGDGNPNGYGGGNGEMTICQIVRNGCGAEMVLFKVRHSTILKGSSRLMGVEFELDSFEVRARLWLV